MLLLTLVTSDFVAADDTVTIKMALLATSGEQRQAWLKVTSEFSELFPNVKFKTLLLENEPYHNYMQDWHNQEVDILYGFAGQRLRDAIDTGNVANLTDIWQDSWSSQFAKLKQVVSQNAQVYALPISYYHWGFFYNRLLFEELNIAAPRTFSQLNKISKRLKANGVYPFIFPGSDGWMASSWFSYLNIRVNGKEFHLRVLRGEVSFGDEKIRRILSEWQTLIDADWFHPQAYQFDIRQSLPLLFRKDAAMILGGNFISKHARKEFRSKIGFFTFPEIKKEFKHIEEAPTDVLFIHKNSSVVSESKAFLKFLSQPEIIFAFNETVGYISPNKNSPQSEDYFVKQGVSLLQGATGTTQFLDRDSNKSFSEPLMRKLSEFMTTGDVDKTIEGLERVRTDYIRNRGSRD
ncbi:MAG: extracellular solute-binding protein [Alteromonadaceae bacterium]|nr:extracellular solute-binding protein [Alteromonadaceae bacterium]